MVCNDNQVAHSFRVHSFLLWRPRSCSCGKLAQPKAFESQSDPQFREPLQLNMMVGLRSHGQFSGQHSDVIDVMTTHYLSAYSLGLFQTTTSRSSTFLADTGSDLIWVAKQATYLSPMLQWSRRTCKPHGNRHFPLSECSRATILMIQPGPPGTANTSQRGRTSA